MLLFPAFACEDRVPPLVSPVPAKVAIDASRLVVEVSAPTPMLSGQPLMVEVVVSNPTNAAKDFCVYHTPFEGMRNNIFSITADGRDIEYRGEMAKRAAPGPEDYLRLEPGASKKTSIDLAEGYELPAGVYQVAFRGSSISGLESSAPISITVGS